MLGGEAVAGLDLERRHAGGENSFVRRPKTGQQLIVGRLPSGENRRPDTSAGTRDLRERRPGEPQLVLGVAAAGEQRVRVTLDQAGEHGLPACVEGRGAVVPVPEHLLGGPDGGDPTVADRDCAIGEQIEFALLGPTPCCAAVGEPCELGGAHDVEIAHGVALAESAAVAPESSTGWLRFA